MNRSLLRPTAALFPLAGLTAMIVNPSANLPQLFEAYFLLQLLSLCAVDCFRNAAAREPGVRRVDKRFGGAMVQLFAGIVLLFLLSILDIISFDEYTCAAAALIIIEQLFEERMFALARRMDGTILSLVANGLLLAGFLLNGRQGLSTFLPNLFTLCAAGLGALIAAATSYAVEPSHGFSPRPANLPFVPRACLQTLAYPAAIAAICLVRVRTLDIGLSEMLESECPFILAGLTIWRIARTVCRRSTDESRPLNLLLTAVASAVVLPAIWMPEILNYAVAVEAALICAAAIFCAPSVRLWSGVTLNALAIILIMLSPFIPPINTIAAILCTIAAIVLNLHHAFLRKV